MTLHYDGCWWDNRRKRRVSVSFHILDRLVVPDEDDSRVVSSFTWGKDFFDSCRAGNLKRLDLDIYFGLKSALSKQLYRHLDKRFYLRPEWIYDLRELAFEHVGMSRNYTAALLKAKLQPALAELEGIDFLEPMTAAERYTKTGRGAWNIRLIRKRPAPAEAKPAEPEPTGLEQELVERGVTGSVAAELVRAFPEDRLRRQVEVLDWLREHRPTKVKDVGAYLAEAIRKDFAAPAGFRSQAERAEAEATARARREQQEQTRRAKDHDHAIEALVSTHWQSLTPEQRTALEAAALAGAAPADRAAYAAAAAPVRRLLLVGLRDALIRHRLGLPAADRPARPSRNAPEPRHGLRGGRDDRSHGGAAEGRHEAAEGPGAGGPARPRRATRPA